MSETIRPTIRLRPATRGRGRVWGWYFNSSMAFQTRWAVSASTRDGLLMVRDTVDVDTRARRATSWMVRLSGRRCEGSVTGLTARLYLGCRPQSRGEMKFCEQYIEKPLTPSCDLA